MTKPGVSLEKEPGRTGILGSRLLDLDLVAQICSARVLIAGVHVGSDSSGEMGCGAAALSPEVCSRGGGSPAMANLGLLGVEKGEIWVGKHLLGTGDLHVASERRCGDGKGLLDGKGGSAATELAGARCLGT